MNILTLRDVRGIGLFWAVDLVKNRATKEPMNTNDEKVQSRPLVTDKAGAAMMQEGMSVMSESDIS
jgi:taurine--2-oxoglutarate transaminase